MVFTIAKIRVLSLSHHFREGEFYGLDITPSLLDTAEVTYSTHPYSATMATATASTSSILVNTAACHPVPSKSNYIPSSRFL